MEKQLVVVKDGKTVNLKDNRLIFDGDLISHKPGGEADKPLADGLYDILGVDFCMQHDDNDRKKWILTNDPQDAIRSGWPRRMVYYYWKDINGWRDKPHPSVKLITNISEETIISNKTKVEVDMDDLTDFVRTVLDNPHEDFYVHAGRFIRTKITNIK